ncbi:hypothetical protein F4819DRAFT_261456 [Hypoxylon fuscum]|nr:hypothetical protein F4819DRAFT_261456 [Hypoxylon fuscum]
MNLGTLKNAENTIREGFASSRRDSETDGQQQPYTPTNDEYREILQDLADLHGEICTTADTIENMLHTPSCSRLWDQIWLTLHLAGATTEGVWDIVRYTWLETLLDKGRLGLGEWETLKEFIEIARDTIIWCDRIIANWDTRGEHKSCLELYKALREFPIAKQKKRKIHGKPEID